MGLKDKFFKKNQPEQTTSKITLDIIAELDFPCEVINTSLHDDKSLFALYTEALANGKRDGWTALIIIPSDVMLELLMLRTQDNAKKGIDNLSASINIIREANSLNTAKVLTTRYENSMPIDEPGFNESDLIGKIEDGNPLHTFISANDFAQKRLYPELILAKIPDADAFNMPAYIPMGGFNDCPIPEEQIAIFKYWHKRFGVYPAVVGYDTWECYVENPPSSDPVALGLAKEQMAFCSDIVYQGLNTIGALADSLKNAPVWFFWWD